MCIVICTLLLSRPARGAWVEMLFMYYLQYYFPSRPARGAWVEIKFFYTLLHSYWSRPARGAWVEIERSSTVKEYETLVAPRKGRVG